MIQKLIVEALYLHGHMTFKELSERTGLTHSDIAFRGADLCFGGMIDFSPEEQVWFYVEDCWL